MVWPLADRPARAPSLPHRRRFREKVSSGLQSLLHAHPHCRHGWRRPGPPPPWTGPLTPCLLVLETRSTPAAVARRGFIRRLFLEIHRLLAVSCVYDEVIEKWATIWNGPIQQIDIRCSKMLLLLIRKKNVVLPPRVHLSSQTQKPGELPPSSFKTIYITITSLSRL
jgi:hypothetical protein